MSSIKNIFAYFRDCYQHDLKSISILNFFDRKTEHRLIFKNFEPLQGPLRQIPVDSKWGAKVDEELATHSQEKSLYCCSFFLKGKVNVLGKSTKAFIPLYIHEVSLVHRDEVYYVEVDAENPIINPAFLEYLKSNNLVNDLSFDIFSEAFPRGFLNFKELFRLKEILQDFAPDLNIGALESLMENSAFGIALEEIYKSRTTKTDNLLLNGLALGVFPKSKGSRGVLNELRSISETNSSSKIVEELFSPTNIKKAKNKAREILSPVSLSTSQKQVFHSLDNHDLTLVVGPPGTGKSFTIAALTVDLINRGKSVLIASKNSQAGRVIAQKVEQDFRLKGVLIKASRGSYKNTLLRKLENIVFGISSPPTSSKQLGIYKKEIDVLFKKNKTIEDELVMREKEEVKWGRFFYNYNYSFFQKIRWSWISNRAKSRTPVWVLKEYLDIQRQKLNRKIRIYIKHQYASQLHIQLSKSRSSLKHMIEALKNDVGNLIQENFAQIDFKILLEALPAWICNAGDIHGILPAQKELFDVVIMDEATQCDIASSLPLLHRAKKAIIVGDPKQLRHLSFLSKVQQQNLLTANDLTGFSMQKMNYRNLSILDLVSNSLQSQDQIVFLNEHYRSKPPIIKFSNQQFYGDRLQIMTTTPASVEEQSVFLHVVEGKRGGNGQNEIEVESLIQEVKELIEREAGLEPKFRHSIGILSPFRSQVMLLKTSLRKRISVTAMRQHKILIGTPHHFQGEERDVMFLSFSVDDDTHPSTYIYLNRPEVFNVSITRARSKQHVFCSVSESKLNAAHIFGQYISSIRETAMKAGHLSTYEVEDAFMEEVIAEIKSLGIETIYRSYPLGGVDVDIVAVYEGQTYCIDLVGYPGAHEGQFPLENWNVLNRMQLEVFSLPYSMWILNKKRATLSLRRFFFESKDKPLHLNKKQ